MMEDQGLLIRQMECGPMQNFIYFLVDAASGQAALVDPAWEPQRFLREVKDHQWELTSIFLTHGHPDHVNALPELQTYFDVPVYISAHEADFFRPDCRNLTLVTENDVLSVGNLKFQILHTPGHSPGCQCFLYHRTLITGDTLFIDGCGRCDLPGSDPSAMYDSLMKKIRPLPEATRIFPGHNYGPVPHATLAEQKQTNPYLQCLSKEEFLRTRMGVAL